ncbi:MAG: hypothetical protein ACO29O_02735 [Chitinophagaceae bacterium]
MRTILMALIIGAGMNHAKAQLKEINVKSDTIIVNDDNMKKSSDTIRVGNIIIITNDKKDEEINQKENKSKNEFRYNFDFNRKKKKKSDTKWFTFDLGFSGFEDKTNYSTWETRNFLQYIPSPNMSIYPLNKGDFAYKGTRISNFNLWFFTKNSSLIRNVVNLRYGLGIESNNYFYKTNITYVDGSDIHVTRQFLQYTKNKLVANYLTVPLMINFNTSPGKKSEGLQFSAGISGGYLYAARQKQVSIEEGKQKNKTDFNLERFKLSYIAELGLGPIMLYGTYAVTPLHQYALQQYPFTVGIRITYW